MRSGLGLGLGFCFFGAVRADTSSGGNFTGDYHCQGQIMLQLPYFIFATTLSAPTGSGLAP